MLNIPIVVAAYNRPASLARLLSSLEKASYPSRVQLIISIDGGTENSEVIDVAKSFHWPHGEKTLVISNDNMGLRRHILKCGRLAKQHDGIILLEDDLYVSPYFYSYVTQAQKFYMNDSKVAGVALYSHSYNETACLPFVPIDDGYDVFFMQIPCSWGQSWTCEQWEKFEDWYDVHEGDDLKGDENLPPDVRVWPDSSWKKYFLKYLLDKDLLFVYPRKSHVTNFADPGVHHQGTNTFQVPIVRSDNTYEFSTVSDSSAVYDCYCELLPSIIKKYAKILEAYDFEMDLYGMKNRKAIRKMYVLTTQFIDDCVMTFGRRMKPHEMNVIENISGEDICLGETSKLKDYGKFFNYRNSVNQDYKNTHGYFYMMTKWHYKPTQLQKGEQLHERFRAKIKRAIGNKR